MKRNGFTLIELLVAIAIIGILAGAVLMIVNPVEQLKKSRDAQRKHDLSQVQKALEVYYNDKGKYPLPTEIPWGGRWSGYMEVVPKDPKSGQAYEYQQEQNTGGYRLFATLERCSDSQIIANINCTTEQYNYSVVSPNLTVSSIGEIPPTSTPMPTRTPTPTSVLASCADGTVEQTYSSSMVGCNGSEKFDSAASLCIAGTHVCTASEYFARGGNATIPTADRWLSSQSSDVRACTVANGSCQSGSTTCYVLVPNTQDNIFGLYSDSNYKRAYNNNCNDLADKIGWISHDHKNKKFGAMCCSR